MSIALQQNNESYFSRSEVSHSNLSDLERELYSLPTYGDKEKAFRLGSLIDAVVTEWERVNVFKRTVDDEVFTAEEFDMAIACRDALRLEAKKDNFLHKVLSEADTQFHSINKNQAFFYGNFKFELDTRCKWDWYFKQYGFGGDLKSTAATSQKQFEDSIQEFNWDRSRAWYMDVVGSQRDFIYAVSKENFKVFKLFITRGDKTYESGYDKYIDLAFKWWMLFK